MTKRAERPGKAQRPKIGLVLAGGSARGAYEVGVIEHIVEDVSNTLGYDVPLDILSGTSVGAINCCTLAAFADEPRARAARLRAVWTGLRVEELLRPKTRGVADLLRGLVGRGPSLFAGGSIFEATYLEQLIRQSIPFERIDKNLREGRLSAVTASSTHIASGRTVVFVQRKRAHPPPWKETANIMPRSVRLRPVHALASAAVPLLFPPVKIEGRYYCDGGLRQNVPLSPARRLGAAGMIVINPRYVAPRAHVPHTERRGHEEQPSPLTLLGKTLNALMLDRIDNDLDRLEKVNDVLAAGCRRYGDTFTKGLRESMGQDDKTGLRHVEVVHVRPSQDIGSMCADYVSGPDFKLGGVLGSIMKRLADTDATREADLLSYLLLDGDFAGRLIDLGRADAKHYHNDFCNLFERLRQAPADDPDAFDVLA
jgi:NTE family protein